jgi:hypothetical protein
LSKTRKRQIFSGNAIVCMYVRVHIISRESNLCVMYACMYVCNFVCMYMYVCKYVCLYSVCMHAVKSSEGRLEHHNYNYILISVNEWE